MYRYQLPSLSDLIDSDMLAVNKYPLFYIYIFLSFVVTFTHACKHTFTLTHTAPAQTQYILVLDKLIHIAEVLNPRRLDY